jgi:hypothetical protein
MRPMKKFIMRFTTLNNFTSSKIMAAFKHGAVNDRRLRQIKINDDIKEALNNFH